MKKLVTICAVATMILAMSGISQASSTYHVNFDFETSWTGDYVDGWENTSYRHGEAPVGKMMQQTTTSYTGAYGMKLIADSVASSSQFWAGVNASNVASYNMTKEHNPWMSAWYYDELGDTKAGQIFAVPDWVNPYISGTEDWTDVQFGARNSAIDNYYAVAAGEGSPGWVNTNVARTEGWHQLKMQLSSVTGHIIFTLDGAIVGESYRNDYIDLGTVGLYTMFDTPLSVWGEDKPYTIWDNVEFGSSAVVPVPGAVILGGLGVGLVGWMKRRKTL